MLKKKKPPADKQAGRKQVDWQWVFTMVIAVLSLIVAILSIVTQIVVRG